MLESVFDLPTHVLVVHAPVVLIPLVALATIAAVTTEQRQRRYGVALLAGTAVTLVVTLLAMKTGEEFDSLLEGQVDTDDHERYAERTMWFVAAWFVSVIALVAVLRRLGPRRLAVGLAGVAVVLASVSTYWVVRTGHEGARITWDGTVPVDE